MDKIAVYTCITGGYDYLKEIPVEYLDKEHFDYICFTDNSELTSETWILKPIPEKLSKLTNVKKQRILKILPHVFLPEYEKSLWIDGNIMILGEISDCLAKYDLRKTPLYTLKHPTRDCIYDEEKAVLRLKKDKASITNPQMRRYQQEGFPRHFGLIESRILYRNHNDKKLKDTMFLWANELLKGSHRDQLSFNYVCWKIGLKYGEFAKEDAYRTFKWLIKHPKENLNTISITKNNPITSIDIYTVNFNHSELTNAWIKSVLKNVSGIKYRIFVVDNSDKVPFVLDTDIDKSLVNIIDNTDDKIIPIGFVSKYFSRVKNSSIKHSITIQWILDNCNADNIVLFDCDTILKRNLDFLDDSLITIAPIMKAGSRFRKRFFPIIQYFNVKMMNESGIRFFDYRRTYGDISTDGTKLEYDTGASFLDDVTSKKLPYKIIDAPSYINHLAGGTYRQNSNSITNFILQNKCYCIKKDIELIISLTTWKNRLERGNLCQVLSSIINQKTRVNFKIVITLFKDDCQYIGKSLQSFIEDNNIEVIIVDEDLKPHKKYFYVMQKYRNLPIITIDDDVLYSPNTIEDLYNSYLTYSQCISAKRVHEITYYKNGNAKPYRQWNYECKTILDPSINLLATGVAGVLYPPNILQISDNDLEKIQLSLTNDDLFLKKKEMELGIKTVYVPSRNEKYDYTPLPEFTGKEALSVSSNNKNNDIIIHDLNLIKLDDK